MNYEVAIAAATNLALSAHSGQVRKYTGEAYFAHPMRVAASVEALYPGNPHAVLIAILHDVVEDTEVTIEEFCFSTPRICMHMCFASTTTITPKGFNVS